MKMRLGSVLKFKAALAKKIGSCPICLHCVHCHNELTNEGTEILSDKDEPSKEPSNLTPDHHDNLSKKSESTKENCKDRSQTPL